MASRAPGNAAAIGSAVLLALLALQRYTHDLPGSGDAFPLARERCYAVARAGHNDCGTAAHACAGRSVRDRAGDEWISLPAGTCARIAGGSPVPATAAMEAAAVPLRGPAPRLLQHRGQARREDAALPATPA